MPSSTKVIVHHISITYKDAITFPVYLIIRKNKIITIFVFFCLYPLDEVRKTTKSQITELSEN